MLVVSALHSTMKQSKQQLATVHRLPLYFFIASAFWQFLGSAVLGLLINFPIINYFEHGTFLTVAHGHAAFLGAFGFLALGLLVYCFRHAFPGEVRTRKLWWGFWLMNVGLFIMVFFSVTPIGVIQLVEVVKNGYASARSVAFYERDWVMFFNELRMPGDTLIIIGAALYAYVFLKKVLSSGLLIGRMNG
jgi:nitric oxide reductase subunit B